MMLSLRDRFPAGIGRFFASRSGITGVRKGGNGAGGERLHQFGGRTGDPGGAPTYSGVGDSAVFQYCRAFIADGRRLVIVAPCLL